MTYLVMECHPAYVVVLSSDGQFIKAANFNYAVGDRLDNILPMQEPQVPVLRLWKRTTAVMGGLAACLCLGTVGVWALSPVGSVRMSINPSVLMQVNRLGYVTKLEGLNADGEALIEGTRILGKKLKPLTDELADRAVEMGFLADGGQISLTILSDNVKWKTATEEMLVVELELHFENNMIIALEDDDWEDDAMTVTIPIPDDDDDSDDRDDDKDDGDDDDDSPASQGSDDDDDDDAPVSQNGGSDDDDNDVSSSLSSSNDDDNAPASSQSSGDDDSPAQPEPEDDDAPAQPESDNDDSPAQPEAEYNDDDDLSEG